MTITAIALLLATLTPVVVAALLAIPLCIELDGFPDALPLVASVTSIFAAVVSVLAAPLVALPLYSEMQSRKIAGLKAYILAGLLPPAILIAVIESVNLIYHDGLQGFVFWYVVIGAFLSGPLATLVFWLIRRPDLDRR